MARGDLDGRRGLEGIGRGRAGGRGGAVRAGGGRSGARSARGACAREPEGFGVREFLERELALADPPPRGGRVGSDRLPPGTLLA
jgi:hypothetical protein